MDATSPRWQTIADSESPWERDALTFVRERLLEAHFAGEPPVLGAVHAVFQAGLGFHRYGLRPPWRVPAATTLGDATLHLMSNGAKWIVGTGVAIITAIVGSAVAVVAVVVTLAGDVRADLREVRADLTTQIGDVRADLRDVRDSMESLDARLRAVEVGFGKIDQRLLTIERVVLPAPPPGE